MNPEAVRTSTSHPLRIDAVPAGAGEIGITFCPGKRGPGSAGFVWRRDLEQDLDVVADWGARAVVTLIEDFEFGLLGVPTLGQRIRARGIEWFHWPVVDLRPPDARLEAGWSRECPRLLHHLHAGGRIVVHCRGGLGRSGTVCARLLVAMGRTPAQAIECTRRARPGAIETPDQERYVRALDAGPRVGRP
jgi:ADP-ribosyl-[dinitrogen reductase] hydrolase